MADQFDLSIQERARRAKTFLARIKDSQFGARQEAFQNQGRARENTATDNADSPNVAQLRQEHLKGALVFLQDEPLKSFRAQDQFFQAIQTAVIQPAEHGGPSTRSRAVASLGGQSRPVFGRAGVVLDVIAVVKEQPVVNPAVVAGGAAGVFEVSLELAKPEAE